MLKNCPDCKNDFETENPRRIFCDACKDEHKKRVMREACKKWRQNNRDYKQIYKTRMKTEKRKTEPVYAKNSENIEVIRNKRKQQEIMRRFHGL
jgi:hypothetical protein